MPTTILLTLRSRAKARRASLTLAPERTAVSAPSCSASFVVAASAARSAAESGGCDGLSTETTIHSARSRAAIRRAARTSRSLSGLGRTQTRIRSATGHVSSIAWSRR